MPRLQTGKTNYKLKCVKGAIIDGVTPVEAGRLFNKAKENSNWQLY